MALVLVNSVTGEVGEMQSHGTPGILLKNREESFVKIDGVETPLSTIDWEEKTMTPQEYGILLDNDPTRVAEREEIAEEILIAQKMEEIITARDKKEAIRLLKVDNIVIKYHHDNGNRVKI